jgi:hypothetical protein
MIQLAQELTLFDRGLAIGVIAFFMGLMAWAIKRYFGKGGIADQRIDAVEELTHTCHGCREEQQELHRRLDTCIELLNEGTDGS